MKFLFLFASAALFGDIWQISSENFSQIPDAGRPVIVEVHADWCGSCKAMAPVFQAASQQYTDVQFAEIDADAEHKLVRQFRVTGLPTILFFKPGQSKPAMKHTGALSQQEFNAKIDQFLNTIH